MYASTHRRAASSSGHKLNVVVLATLACGSQRFDSAQPASCSRSASRNLQCRAQQVTHSRTQSFAAQHAHLVSVLSHPLVNQLKAGLSRHSRCASRSVRPIHVPLRTSCPWPAQLTWHTTAAGSMDYVGLLARAYLSAGRLGTSWSAWPAV